MDNLNSSAYPLSSSNGFTKLELASLMIAQGLVKGWWEDGLGANKLAAIKADSVAIATAVLEEANK